MVKTDAFESLNTLLGELARDYVLASSQDLIRVKKKGENVIASVELTDLGENFVMGWLVETKEYIEEEEGLTSEQAIITLSEQIKNLYQAGFIYIFMAKKIYDLLNGKKEEIRKIEELIDKARKGDQEAEKRVVGRYGKSILEEVPR